MQAVTTIGVHIAKSVFQATELTLAASSGAGTFYH
jgi:hypothetical protein